MMTSQTEVLKADTRGDYGTIHGSTAKKKKTCFGCAHDTESVVEGEYVLCQRKGGGKDDLSCWLKREVTQYGKQSTHIESNNIPRGRPKGKARVAGGSKGPTSHKMHCGKLVYDIVKESGVSRSTIDSRLRNNPDITLERLMRKVIGPGGTR